MRFKKILFILCILICFPKEVFAARCDNAEKVMLSSFAQNISVTYDYVEENHQVSFHIIFTNLQPGLKLKDVTNNKEYYYNGSEITLYGYKPGTNYRFDVYADTECKSRLYSHYVTLPGYNPYYDDAVCNEVNASICQKWVKINYDYDTFVNEVNKYKQDNMDIPNKENEETVLGIYDYIFQFLKKYYYIIFPLIIIVGISGIIILRKKDNLF